MFTAFYNDLMLANSGLTKLAARDRGGGELGESRFYCLTAHGQAVRQLSGDPKLGEMLVMNYRAAALSERQRAMCDFAVKMTRASAEIEEIDREALRAVGFTDRDIWDIAAVTGFFNMTNRVASATDMRPNDEYHAQNR